MISRDQREEYAQQIADIYAQIEDQILFNIADRIKKHNSLLTEEGYDAWQVKMLQELGDLSQEQLLTIVKGSGKVKDEVEKLLMEIGMNSADAVGADVKEIINQGGLILESVKIPDGIIESVVTHYFNQALDKLNLTGTTMLGTSSEAYRKILDDTIARVIAGTMSPQKALREAIKQAATDGVAGLIDRAGRHWTPEAYVNTVMRTTIANTAREAMDSTMNHHGISLIEVTSHQGARPLCAPYQGRIYSRIGFSHPEYPNLSETSFGEPAGLFGINCGHTYYPYVEGVSIQRNYPNNTEANDAAYQESQVQRKIERTIRKYKRQEAMLQRADDAEGATLARQKVRTWQDAMKEFIEETGRTRRRNREQIYS